MSRMMLPNLRYKFKVYGKTYEVFSFPYRNRLGLKRQDRSETYVFVEGSLGWHILVSKPLPNGRLLSSLYREAMLGRIMCSRYV